MGRIDAAHGRFVIMGDADDSYDFGGVPAFVERRARATSGAGLPAQVRRRTVLPGAVFASPLARQPDVLADCAARFAPRPDIYCGLRGFTKRFTTRSTSAAPGWSSPPR
jgi:hypothetical protein